MKKSALAKALMHSKSKSEVKRKVADAPGKGEAWQDAVDELYDAIKSGDEDGFKETLKAAIEIATSEDGVESL